MNEAQRRNLIDDLRHPLWGDAADHELADWHGVPVREVRELRASLRQDLEAHAVRTRTEELALIVAHKGSMRALLVRVLDAALRRARSKQGYGQGHSVGADQRQAARPQRVAGVSGDRDPRRQAPRGPAGAVGGRRMGDVTSRKTREG